MRMEREEKFLELYIHIPFCVRKCLYCDFLSYPREHWGDGIPEYLAALEKELRLRSHQVEGYRVCSVFFGGGTPSLLEGGQVQALMDCIRQYYDLLPEAEVTMECNPGTLTEEKACSYRRGGVNRLSIGLQSAVDEELKALGRIHTCEEFRESYGYAVAAGFDNINVDLMSALPGQTLASYDHTLDYVLGLDPVPVHISAYSLIVEENTPFAGLQEHGKLALPEEEEEREMYLLTAAKLSEAGLHRYEISNYARPGYTCRHNVGYWTRKPYLGFGPGAASLLEERRWRNPDSLQEYQNAMAHGDPRAHLEREKQFLTVEERRSEYMFLGLRMTLGISEEEYRQRYGGLPEEHFGEAIRKHMKEGLLQREQGRLFLTERGLDLANYVMADFV